MSRKDILWLGGTKESAPDSVANLLKQIQFVDLSVDEFKPSRTPPAIVIIDGLADPADIERFFNRFTGELENAETVVYATADGNASKAVDFINQRPVGFLIDDTKELPRLLQTLLSQHSLKKSRSEIESKVARMRGLIRFVKDLSTVLTLEEMLRLLRQETKAFQNVKDPMLVSLTPPASPQIYYFQGAQVLAKKCDMLGPQGKKIRFNDKQDSQYLADLFGRPFAKLIAVPIGEAVLFFEHAFQENRLKDFLNFIEERLQPMAIAVDRLFLEHDLKEASLEWERTFDGIQDPVAIFDLEGHLLRANRAYSENFAALAAEDLSMMQEPTIRMGDRIFQTFSYPIALNKGEQPTNVVNHYVDVTVSHKLQQQMIQNEKMAAIGHLAGHIAHELNNPLTGVRSLAQVLIPQIAPESNTHKDLVEVERAAERCQLIIKNLLEFSSGSVSRTKVSLNDIVMRTLPLLKTAMSPFTRELNLCEDSVDVDVEPQLMQQVFFNLVKNACQAMKDKGILTIETRVSDDGKHAELIVSDTGSGMPPDVQEHIFDFFFTTKSQGQGTGLGLSMSKSIVDQFGGEIVVQSQVGEGSRFCVRLPRARETKP